MDIYVDIQKSMKTDNHVIMRRVVPGTVVYV